MAWLIDLWRALWCCVFVHVYLGRHKGLGGRGYSSFWPQFVLCWNALFSDEVFLAVANQIRSKRSHCEQTTVPRTKRKGFLTVEPKTRRSLSGLSEPNCGRPQPGVALRRKTIASNIVLQSLRTAHCTRIPHHTITQFQ